MPKVATKPEPQLEAPEFVDPLDILLTNSVPPTPEAPTVPEHPPVEFEPATEDEDEDEEDEAEPHGMAPDLAAILNNFLLMMDEREERLKTFVEERLAQVRVPETNGTAYTAPTELAAVSGQYPASMQHLAPQESSPEVVQQAPPRRSRMVAFIPKEDPFNPRHTDFVTWLNGREYRGKRGQVMILTSGHAMSLARSGHGNCVDIAAMQGIGNMEPIPVQQHPDYSRPNDWNGLPTNQQSSIPIR